MAIRATITGDCTIFRLSKCLLCVFIQVFQSLSIVRFFPKVSRKRTGRAAERRDVIDSYLSRQKNITTLFAFRSSFRVKSVAPTFLERTCFKDRLSFQHARQGFALLDLCNNPRQSSKLYNFIFFIYMFHKTCRVVCMFVSVRVIDKTGNN